MKAGTTTLYRDMLQHPGIYLPSQKEPDTLVRFSTRSEMESDYESLFSNALPGQLKGEASTAYTKRPTHEGVAERALDVCGPSLKIIYIRRDPLQRIISQYRHELAHGTIKGNFAEAVRRYPHLIDYSKYDWQIEPWIRAFGNRNVLQIDLDNYSADREGQVRLVISHLGLNSSRLRPIDVEQVANQAREVKRLSNPFLQSFITSNFYQRKIRSLLSARARERIRNRLLPAMEVHKIEIDDATRIYIAEQLESEMM